MRFSFIALLAMLVLNGKPGDTQVQRNQRQPIQIVNGYPEFQFHGQPFFPHSTAFFYNRLPRSEWAASLVKLKELGINTIDLYLTWSWHEPEEGQLDFDGHSNPRRDVKALLAMLDAMGFAVIARPGPVILNEWRNGGYPDWLLKRPEYAMHEVARLDGHYPPLSGLSASNSEEASKQWLANATHLSYTRKWFGEVMRELLKDRQATQGGNVIAIQLDDDQAINRANYNGPVFWQYMTTLAGYLRAAGATVPLYINPTDMRVSAAGAPHNIGAMGQWYFNFGNDPALRWEDTAVLQLYAETLKTQPRFPPMLIEYQAGWYGTGDDTYAKTADTTNTLLSSRVLLGHGLKGLNYFPVQDTLYPAGYEVPWANHYYTWESALNLAGQERPRAEAVHRNGRLIAGLGRELAQMHKVADVGLVYPISSFEQAMLTREDVLRISRATLQIQQYCQLNQVAVEYLDLEFQPLEHLQRHKALLLPVFDDAALARTAATGREEITAANETAAAGETRKGGKLQLSRAAQQKLADYVRAGGKLICSPRAPQGEIIGRLAGNANVLVLPEAWWRDVPLEPGQVTALRVSAGIAQFAGQFADLLWRAGGTPIGPSVVNAATPLATATVLTLGEGAPRGLLCLTNFDEHEAARLTLREFGARVWLRPREALLLPYHLPLFNREEEPARSAAREEIVWATGELVSREFANGRLALRFYAPDEMAVALKLAYKPAGAVTVDGAPAQADFDEQRGQLRIALATPKAGGAPEREVLIEYERPVTELNVKTTRLLVGQDNQISVEINNRSGALLRGTLTLLVQNGLKQQRLTQTEVTAPPGQHTLSFSLPVGAAAVAGDWYDLRALFVDNGHSYFSPTQRAEISRRFSWEILPPVTWPLRADTAQRITPPLFYPTDDNATEAKLKLQMTNHSPQPLTLNRSALGVASEPLKLKPDEVVVADYTYSFAPGAPQVLNPFEIAISDGATTEVAKAAFVALKKGAAVAFAYDVDQDGFDDYVLENEHLRLIVSPNAGARAFALIDKHSGVNAFTSVGGLRDKFVELDPTDPTRNARRKRGMYGTFNRPYAAEILSAQGARAALRLSYYAADAYPDGARIERFIVLAGGADYFTVDYLVTPKTPDGVQAFWSSNSLAIGDPVLQTKRWVVVTGAFAFTAAQTKTLDVNSGWVAAPVNPTATLAVLWRSSEVQTAEVEMKDFSSFINLKFKPFVTREPQAYRVAFALGAWTPARLLAERARILGR
ncbi:MAG: beta-galactosidase [Acidobacteria bacterium]|nr:beta-galactosidase [Acidobacteriota bacterium]MBI3423782.1 beta-galactosidase [Acidobacteriota bacterium]